MKTTKLILAIAFFAFSTMAFAQTASPDVNEPSPTLTIKITLRAALHNPALAKAIEVQGYLIRERKHTNDHFSIDENGNLLFFAPQNDIEIDGIPCRGQKDVQLFQDGELMRCYLSKSFEINGVIYKNDSHLLFDEQGNVEIFNMSLFNKISILSINHAAQSFYRTQSPCIITVIILYYRRDFMLKSEKNMLLKVDS